MDLKNENMSQDLPSSSGSKKRKASTTFKGDVETVHARKIRKKTTEDDDGGHDLQLGLANGDNPIAPAAANNQQVDDSLINTIGRDLTILSLVHCPRYTYGCVATLNRSFRELVRGGDLYRERRRQDVVEHWVNFSCTQKCNWKAFDPIFKKWINLPTLITNDPCFDFSDKESMGVGTQLLVLGNDMLGPGIYQYSIQTNSWLPAGQPMNVPRCLFGSASVKTEAFFAGGVDRTGRIVDTVESYNSETGIWTTLPSLLKPRKMSSGVFMDGKFYVIGGTGGGQDKRALTCGEEYDLNARRWTEIPNMSPAGGGTGSMAPPLLAVVRNELYAADHGAMELKLYKKKSNEWATIGRLPERIDHTQGWGIAFRGCGERLIILGGPRRDGDTHLEIYSWVPSQGPPKWTLLGRKRTDSFVYNCTIMGC